MEDESRVELGDFYKLYKWIDKFILNLGKEGQDRRNNLDRVNQFLLELDHFQNQYCKFKDQYGIFITLPEDISKVKRYISYLDSKFLEARSILAHRLERIQISDSSSNMPDPQGEKFDLKTAASLLPNMDGTENGTKQLIDAIEFYNTFLNNEGKVLLVQYVLKTKLTQSAKIRLNSTYASVKDLLDDMRRCLITQKSAASLATQLHNCKQEGRSIEQFGRTIEQLFLDLTIAESNGNQNSLNILQGINEKLAINSFSNGLRNNDLRIIVKARNYQNLKDAIIGAQEEEKTIASSSSKGNNLFYSRGKKNFNIRGNQRGGYYSRGRFSNQQRPAYRQTNNDRSLFRPSFSQQNSNNNYNNNNTFYRGRGRGRSFSRTNNSRGFSNRAYFAENTGTQVTETENRQQFFRDE